MCNPNPEAASVRNSLVIYTAHVATGCLATRMRYISAVESLRAGAVVAILMGVTLLVTCACRTLPREPATKPNRHPTHGWRGVPIPLRQHISKFTPLLCAYATGFFLFVFAYAATGLGLTAFIGYSIGLSVLVVDDLSARFSDMTSEAVAVHLLALALSQLSVFLVLIDSTWAVFDVRHVTDAMNLGAVVATMIVAVPIVVLPLVLYALREHAERHRGYSVYELMYLGAPLACVLAVCTLCAFPPPTPPPPVEVSYAVDAYLDSIPRDDVSLPYRGIDYYDHDANNTQPPPLYTERAAVGSAFDAAVTGALLVGSACVSLPAAYRTIDLILTHRTIDAMLCTTLVLAAKHILFTGDSTCNRFALAGTTMAVLLRGTAAVMYPPKNPPSQRDQRGGYTVQEQGAQGETDGAEPYAAQDPGVDDPDWPLCVDACA